MVVGLSRAKFAVALTGTLAGAAIAAAGIGVTGVDFWNVALLAITSAFFVGGCAVFYGGRPPLLVVDEQGVEVHGVPLAWEEIDAIELRELRPSQYLSWRGRPALDFRPRDPGLLARRAPSAVGRFLQAVPELGGGRATVTFTVADQRLAPVLEAILEHWDGPIVPVGNARWPKAEEFSER
jgi:hypothetical protein